MKTEFKVGDVVYLDKYKINSPSQNIILNGKYTIKDIYTHISVLSYPQDKFVYTLCSGDCLYTDEYFKTLSEMRQLKINKIKERICVRQNLKY